MANNCLVTKLKESVANNNLSKLGVLRIHFVQSQIDNPAFYVQLTAAGDSSMVGKKAQVYTEEGVFVKEITLGYAGAISNNLMTGVTVPGYIEIPNKYLITTLDLSNYPECNVKFSEVTYLPITSLVLKGADADSYLSQLPKTVVGIYINNSLLERGVSGSLADIVNLTAAKELNFANTNIKGDLADLQGKTTINVLGLYSTSNNCGGDIKLFFDAQFANGKTSGTTKVSVDSDGFYYDGVMFTGTKTATFTPEGYTVA